MNLKVLKTALFICSMGIILSCSNDNSDITYKAPLKQNIDEILNSLQFPSSSDTKISYTENSAVKLKGNLSVIAKKLIETLNPNNALFQREKEVTASQLQEIKQKTNEIVQGATTQNQKYKKILKWITSNIRYKEGNNNAYSVFKNKTAVCQGYANLLRLMCYTQEIPAFIVNGNIIRGNTKLGHAWNYVNTNGIWWLSDPTNNKSYRMNEVSKYKNAFEPLDMEIALYKNNNYVIGFKDARLALVKVNKDNPIRFFVPFSYSGFQISSFNPNNLIPNNIKEIIFNKNITSIESKNNNSGLINHHYGRNLKAIYIVKDNPNYESTGDVIYRKSDKKMVFPLETVEKIELKAGVNFEKNIITDLSYLKRLVFPATAKSIDSYAVERCPNLVEVIIPKGCTYNTDSFYQCNANLKITEK